MLARENARWVFQVAVLPVRLELLVERLKFLQFLFALLLQVFSLVRQISAHFLQLVTGFGKCALLANQCLTNWIRDRFADFVFCRRCLERLLHLLHRVASVLPKLMDVINSGFDGVKLGEYPLSLQSLHVNGVGLVLDNLTTLRLTLVEDLLDVVLCASAQRS